MANITNPEAIAFANAMARRFNDQKVSNYWTAKRLVAEFTSRGLSAVFTTNSDVLIDGATVLSGVADGRHPMTTFDINTIMARANELIADFEANSNTKLNQAEAVSVNSSPLF